MKLLIATRSRHKMREIREILGDIPGLEILSLDDAGVPPSEEEDTLEAFDTFEENALAKARHFSRRTGLPTVADDSGLEVEALGGGPGVKTKRFAPGDHLTGDQRDQANNTYLLQVLEGVPPAERAARYVCVAAIVDAAGRERVFRGEAPGRVLEAPRGSSGFGYDPIIEDQLSGRSFAELSPREKHERSHRGKAFRALKAALLRWQGRAAAPGPEEAGGRDELGE